jgi:molybdopterin converting factor small subunit
MKIEVALYATLSKYLPPSAQNRKAVIEVPDRATVDDVLRQLDIPRDNPNILLVNGKQASESTALQDGQTLSVFPPLAGGTPLARDLAVHRGWWLPYRGSAASERNDAMWNAIVDLAAWALFYLVIMFYVCWIRVERVFLAHQDVEGWAPSHAERPSEQGAAGEDPRSREAFGRQAAA